MTNTAQFNTYAKRMCQLREVLKDSRRIPRGKPVVPTEGEFGCPFCGGTVQYSQNLKGHVTMGGCECFTEGVYREGSKLLRKEDLEATAEFLGFKLSEHADKIIERANMKEGTCTCRPNQQVICPCPFMRDEVASMGHCHCNLFIKGGE